MKKTLLVVCSYKSKLKDTKNAFQNGFNIVYNTLKSYYKTDFILSHITTITNSIYDTKTLMPNNDNLTQIIGTFPDDLPPKIFNIIWFAGCSNFMNIRNGLLKLQKYINTDTIIIFTNNGNLIDYYKKSIKDFELNSNKLLKEDYTQYKWIIEMYLKTFSDCLETYKNFQSPIIPFIWLCPTKFNYENILEKHKEIMNDIKLFLELNTRLKCINDSESNLPIYRLSPISGGKYKYIKYKFKYLALKHSILS